MRLAFMGTPDFAAPALAELVAQGFDVAAVYTRPPQPSGRGRRPKASPVHELAERCGLEVRTPTNFRGEADREALKALSLDALAVVAYGLILPRAALDAARLGAFNLHASLLPRWRGAAPIERAIMAGDRLTGVQVMRMEQALDAGPVLLSETVEIRDDDTAATLSERLSRIGASLLPRALRAVERGGAVETPQSEDGATYAEKITAAEARLDWRRPAAEIDRKIRGLSPHPGAFADAAGRKGVERIKILMSRAASGAGAPGEILAAPGGRLVIACGEGAIEALTVQRAGRAAQPAAEFLRGFPLEPGQRL